MVFAYAVMHYNMDASGLSSLIFPAATAPGAAAQVPEGQAAEQHKGPQEEPQDPGRRVEEEALRHDVHQHIHPGIQDPQVVVEEDVMEGHKGIGEICGKHHSQKGRQHQHESGAKEHPPAEDPQGASFVLPVPEDPEQGCPRKDQHQGSGPKLLGPHEEVPYILHVEDLPFRKEAPLLASHGDLDLKRWCVLIPPEVLHHVLRDGHEAVLSGELHLRKACQHLVLFVFPFKVARVPVAHRLHGGDEGRKDQAEGHDHTDDIGNCFSHFNASFFTLS